MADLPFQSLSPDDRRDALEVAAGLSGRRAHLLEKDIWVVQTLAALIETPFGADLTFKGGDVPGEGVPCHSPVFRGPRHYL